MSYVLHDGKGKKVALYSSCTDITYAQAEILLMAEQTKKDHPDGFILGFVDNKLQMTVERFLEAHKLYPEGLKKLESYRSQIKERGFAPFCIREYLGEFESFQKSGPLLQVGRAIDPIVDQMAEMKRAGQDVDMAEMVEDIYANPLHVGVHLEFKPSVADETWIGDAARAIKRTGAEKWLRRMLAVLRFYFKGQPLTPLPNKNDRCPCGSTRKYGKCCGQGVEHEDPEECKLGMHNLSMWEKVGDKLIRNCRKCFRVFEPPWFEELDVVGTKVLVVGCRACTQHPSQADIETEIEEAQKWQVCPHCSQPFPIGRVVIEHLWEDGKHMDRWTVTEVVSKDKSVDLESFGLQKGVFVHQHCFEKIFPAWPKVGKSWKEKKTVPASTREIEVSG